MRTQNQPETSEQRRHERFPGAVGIRVEIDGYDRAMHPFFANGVTVNVSTGGLLARVDRPVPPGSNCSILFTLVAADRQVSEVRGTVVRSDRAPTGCYVAVEFETPLASLPVIAHQNTVNAIG